MNEYSPKTALSLTVAKFGSWPLYAAQNFGQLAKEWTLAVIGCGGKTCFHSLKINLPIRNNGSCVYKEKKEGTTF
jgi:hypothetical protein